MTLLAAFDVSHYQPDTLGSLAGFRLGIAQASANLWPDSGYRAHISAIKAAGLVGGAYCAGYGDHSGSEQAAFFLRQVAAAPKQPDILVIDTREFGMSVAQCNDWIQYVKTHDPLKRPIGIYDSEGNWQAGYVAHDFDWVANYSHIPSRPFAIWQDANHGGPGRGDHDRVDAQWLDRLGISRVSPLWKAGPRNAEVNLGPGKTIYHLDGRTRYSVTTAAVTLKAPGFAPGWTLVLDGSVYAAVRNSDVAAGS